MSCKTLNHDANDTEQNTSDIPMDMSIMAKHKDKTQAWEYRDTVAAGDMDALRSDYWKAREWLSQISYHIGDQLVIDYDSNNRRHDAPLIDTEGRYCQLDTWWGVLSVTNAAVPQYVRRFAMPPESAHTASENNDIGIIGGYSLIAISVNRDDGCRGKDRMETPRPAVIKQIYGLSTPHGRITADPDLLPGVSARLTDEPQVESSGIYVMSEELTEELIDKAGDKYHYWYVDNYLSHKPCPQLTGHDKNIKQHEITVCGMPKERAKAIKHIKAVHKKWAKKKIADITAEFKPVLGLLPY